MKQTHFELLKQCAREISNSRHPQTLKIGRVTYYTICNIPNFLFFGKIIFHRFFSSFWMVTPPERGYVPVWSPFQRAPPTGKSQKNTRKIKIFKNKKFGLLQIVWQLIISIFKVWGGLGFEISRAHCFNISSQSTTLCTNGLTQFSEALKGFLLGISRFYRFCCRLWTTVTRSSEGVRRKSWYLGLSTRRDTFISGLTFW